jgi:hypothetical protein
MVKARNTLKPSKVVTNRRSGRRPASRIEKQMLRAEPTHLKSLHELQPASSAAYCALPGHFFDHAASVPVNAVSKQVLSVTTWDGRDVFSLDSKIKQ